MEALAEQRQSGETVIEATVLKVLYKNMSNDYGVVLFKTAPEVLPNSIRTTLFSDRFVAVGCFLNISEGRRLRLRGEWRKHNKYGERFVVECYEEIISRDKEVLIEYLSGFVKGIGEKTAKAIVDVFGDKTLEIIENEPEKLAAVKGISQKKVRDIVDSYKRSKHLERLVLSFKPFNISTSKIIKIYERYGERAIEEITKNPYRLCEEIEGISFKTADAIARHCKIDPNDDFRIRAGILYLLNETANTEGHVYLPFDTMIEKTCQMLEAAEIQGKVDKNNVIRIAIAMNNIGELIIEKDGAVYLPFFYKAEVYVTQKLKTLLNEEPRKFSYDLDETIEELEQKYNIKYASKQKEAFKMLTQSNIFTITGGPGTGKTTIIKGIIDIWRKNFPRDKISLAAPTGRAAKRVEETTGMEAKTIHRLLEYRPYSSNEVMYGRNEANPLDAGLIIIDECSMVDLILAYNLLRAVKAGTTVIFVGDADQLPSVGPGNVLRDIINSETIPVVFLNEIFRQADTSKIIINSQKINRGECDLEFGEDFIFIEEPDVANIPVLVKEKFMEVYEELNDIEEVQVITPLRKKTETGVEQLNKILQESFNPYHKNKQELHYGNTVFRQGDKVMQYKNNYNKEVYNGDTGLIEAIDNGLLRIQMKGKDSPVEYFQEDLEELQLAYATTVHKSQGCEYHTVIIPATMQHKRMLQRNLIYTAITRAKERVILIGDMDAINYAIRNNKINNRYTKLAQRLKG